MSGYDWRDGIGDRDRRPPRKNPAWKGVEHNDVGTHEFMALCRLIGAEPYIAVNSGLGDAASAASQVEYVNGAAATPMGAQRALNGQQAPFGVRWWSVGNEMYGNWQLGHLPLANYAKKHAEFAAAMRAKDPSIELVAVGDVGPWDEAMLAANAENMSLISEHVYVQEKPKLEDHVAQVPHQIRRIADPERWPVDLGDHLEPAHAAGFFKRIDPFKASRYRLQRSEELGPPTERIGRGTTAFAVADAEGNLIAVTQTLSTWGGNFYVSDGLGFLYNNHLRSNRTAPGVFGQLLPLQRSSSASVPTLLFKGERPPGSAGGGAVPRLAVAAAGNAWISASVSGAGRHRRACHGQVHVQPRKQR